MFDTRPTPGIRFSTSSTFIVAKLLRYISSKRGSSEVRARVINWLADCFSTLIPFCTTSAGSRDSASFTRFCTSTAASSASVEMSKVMVMESPPELELLDSMYNIPGVPFNSCSMGVGTACETVMALAPGYDAEILTTGGVICGYWSTGSWNKPMTPTMTISMDSTAENIGRSMKKPGFMVVPPLLS